MTDFNIELKCQFDRELFWERGDSVRYLVAKVRASDCNSSSRRDREPLNIALAIDVSGSMSGGKLEAAKQAALGLVPKLSSQDRLADNVEVSIQYPAGFHVEILGKSSSLGHAGRLNVDLGPLQNDVERAVVAKVTCPTSAHKQRFEFTASVSARSVGGGEPFQPQFSTALLMAADRGENARCPKSSEIASIVATHWQAHVLNRAGQMNRDRAFREAANYVERELRYFEAYVRELPGSRELVRGLKVLARHVDRDISPRMHKEMTLSSELAFHRRADHRGTAKKSWVDRMVGGD
ncbi:hypothetical protein LCM27_15130 [Ruegeria marisrubri]|uniref:hypothetical protein n=1 Tax=Ruegeria marisrubri TaxID=1685379 RepID=UPI001CD80376|nr:hypothetical protein [Ruegeria marisrubri]MCA0907734.1 hypothetical protein [Ruegeria marisrubri]